MKKKSVLPESTQALVKDLSQDLKPIVTKIENGVKTTRNNYGRYGPLLNRLSKGDKHSANILAFAMIEAGANKQGVFDGLKNFV